MLEDDYAPATRTLAPTWILTLVIVAAIVLIVWRRLSD
jgi:hypothetical protein